MKYEKPELAVVGNASDAIQALTKGLGANDNPQDLPSPPAYEADE
jgi:hypothetical protein